MDALGFQLLDGRRVGDAGHADVLLKLFDLGLKDGNLGASWLSVFHHIFETFVQNFILVSLSLNILPQLLIVDPSVRIALILHHLSLLNQHIHHHIYLLPDLVGFLLKELKRVVAFD